MTPEVEERNIFGTNFAILETPYLLVKLYLWDQVFHKDFGQGLIEFLVDLRHKWTHVRELCRARQIWTGSFSTVTSPQDMISAGAHRWAPAASAQSGSKIATVWWPPSAPQQTTEDPEEPQTVEEPPTSDSNDDKPAYNAEIMNIMSKVNLEKAEESKPKPELSSKPSSTGADLEKIRDWTIAEQLRHPFPVVTLDWSPCNLQRGVHFSLGSRIAASLVTVGPRKQKQCKF